MCVGERRQEACLPQRPKHSTTAVACGFRAPGSEGWRHHASHAACKPQIAEHGRRPCNFRSVSVHVPTMISTPQCDRGYNSLLFEGRPTDLVSNSQTLLRWPYFFRLVWIILDSLENAGNCHLSMLIYQNMNIFGYSSFVKLWHYKNIAVINYLGLKLSVSNQYIKIKPLVKS